MRAWALQPWRTMDRQDDRAGLDPETGAPAPQPVGAPPADAQSAFRRRRRVIPAIIGGGLLMHNLDSTVLANALPAMARSLHEDPLTLNLAITTYLLSAALFLPLSGWVADRFGARRVFMAAMAAFAATSLLCGLAQNIEQVIAGRFLQGMAGAMMLPVGRLVLLRSAPKEELVEAMATLTMPAMLGPILGPPLGGFIVTVASWREIFFLNIPVAIVFVLLIRAYVPDVAEDDPGRLDLKGFVLAASGLGGLVFGFQNISRGVLPLSVALGFVAIGAVCAALFVLHARGRHDAILDLTVFKVRTFFTSVVGGIFPRLIVGASPFLLALMLQVGLGMSALDAGLTTFVSAVGSLVMKTTAPPILRRFGFRDTLIVVSVLTAGMMASFALFQVTTPHWVILAALLISGFFRSLHFTALNTLAFADLPAEKMSKASAIASVGQQVTQGVGVSISALLIHATMSATGAPALSQAVIAPAFVVIAAMALIGLLFLVPLPRNAGASILRRPTVTD